MPQYAEHAIIPVQLSLWDEWGNEICFTFPARVSRTVKHVREWREQQHRPAGYKRKSLFSSEDGQGIALLTGGVSKAGDPWVVSQFEILRYGGRARDVAGWWQRATMPKRPRDPNQLAKSRLVARRNRDAGGFSLSAKEAWAVQKEKGIEYSHVI